MIPFESESEAHVEINALMKRNGKPTDILIVNDILFVGWDNKHFDLLSMKDKSKTFYILRILLKENRLINIYPEDYKYKYR